MSATGAAERRRRLLDLVDAATTAGAAFSPLRDLPQYLQRRRPAWFLKHDVHGLVLNDLVHLAREEHDRNIHGTYFFMTPDHPDTARYFTFSEQADAMRAIQILGHEIGIHVDAWEAIEGSGRRLADFLSDSVEAFRESGVDVRSGNLHGNSNYSIRDGLGNPLQYELFEETARFRDPSTIPDVSDQLISTIRRERCRISDNGLQCWADRALWSTDFGHVVMSYLSDNRLSTENLIQLSIEKGIRNAYALYERLPPSSGKDVVPDRILRTRRTLRRWFRNSCSGLFRLDFHDRALERLLMRSATSPMLVLLHPQFYCERRPR